MSLNRPQNGNATGRMFFVSPLDAEKIFNTTIEKLSAAAGESSNRPSVKKIPPGKLTYKTTVEILTVKTENVLGYLEGSDKKDEVIVITAHYDHIGKKTVGEGDLITNRADDEGAGTV